MSDDRFKQARRSLIDRHNQRQQQGGWDDSFDGDDFEDEATSMVNLDGQPAFAPPPNFAGEEPLGPLNKPTEMFSIDQNRAAAPPAGGVQMRSHSGIQPSYDSFGGPGGGQQPQQPQQGYSPPATEPAVALGDPNQSLVIGGGGVDFEENTAFINLSDFAQNGEAFTPDDTAAGYEGNTQFVNIAALQASGPAGATPVEHDAILQQNYQFGPESIQQGEFTLIFAQNQQGSAVVLKRIWEGDPNGMPIPVRQRIAALDQIRHPQLVALNGMIAAPSGAWVELARPPGHRLTDIISGNGPQDPNMVTEWVRQIAEILSAVHAHAFVYANLNTDAVWIQDDGRIIMEPFDVLAYEQRGNLGVFGAPEMNVPADQQQLSPATDVYSLATVTLAALTGLPLNLGAVEGLEKGMKLGLTAALSQNPAERPPDTMSFLAALKGKKVKGGGAGKPKSKIRVLIPIVALLGVVGLGAAYVVTRPPAAKVVVPAPTGTNGLVPPPTATTPIAVIPPAGDAGTMMNADGGIAVAEAAPKEATAAALAVETDSRLQIRTSFATNPPRTGFGEPSDADLEEAAGYREEARKAITDVDTLAVSAKRARYEEAMEKLALASRLSGGMTAADEELFAELSKESFVKEIREDFFTKIDKSLKEERISRVKQVYPQLAAVDANARELKFFVKNKSVDIKTIDPVEEN